jgi:hypothetical protein
MGRRVLYPLKEGVVMRSYIRGATIEDAVVLAKVLRADDIAEIAAASGQDPRYCLETAVAVSNPAFAFFAPSGKIAGMFGVTPVDEGIGAVWLLASDEVEKYPMTFLRRCRNVLDKLHEKYDLLFNYVDARNETHIQWLRWMGFSFVAYHPKYGVEKRPFYEIVRLKPYV